MAAHVYGNNELVDMLLVYGESQQNSELASRMYAERFPRRFHPAPRRFVVLTQRARDTGQLQPQRGYDGGANRPARILDAEEQILEAFNEDPTSSTRDIGRRFNVSNKVVWRTLHEDSRHPYHYQRAQGLAPADYEARLQFCQWLLQQQTVNPNYFNDILFTDETTFTRTGIFNQHNSHHWSVENPRVIRQSNFQQRFTINIWGGILNGQFIGVHELPPRMDGLHYLDFLRYTMEDYLEDVPLAVRQRMWFMHDGAPIHFRVEVREFLSEQFPHRWIGRGGPVAWPPRSPDINPMDFYVWGFMKDLVYPSGGEPVEDIDDLRLRIENATDIVREEQGPRGAIHRACCESLPRRAQYCIQRDGGHFEHLL